MKCSKGQGFEPALAPAETSVEATSMTALFEG